MAYMALTLNSACLTVVPTSFHCMTAFSADNYFHGFVFVQCQKTNIKVPAGNSANLKAATAVPASSLIVRLPTVLQ